MNIAILQGHPDPAGGHFGHALADAYARGAEHLAVLFPLWLGDMPALVKAFFEQVMRPGFAIDPARGAAMWKRRLKGRSARLVVTMAR